MGQISIRGVEKRFQRSAFTHQVLKGVNLEVKDGEFIAILGSSGCGKTTLLNVIAGLTLPTGGAVLVDDRPVLGPGRDRGVVFQQDTLFLWRSVRRNVEYGLELRGIPASKRRQVALEWLKLVGLERFAEFWPKELSGGMKKRCQIAVVLANDPDILLMDEPYGALDYSTKCELQEELLRVLDDRPKTVFFVTHDIEEAAFLADRVIVMDAGVISAEFRIGFERPRTEKLRLSEGFAKMRQTLSDAIEAPRRKALAGVRDNG